MQLDKQTNFTTDIQALAASHISASYHKRIPIVKVILTLIDFYRRYPSHTAHDRGT